MLKRLALIALLLLSADAGAQSACDSPLHWGQCRESQAGQPSQNTRADERGTSTNPIVVNIAPSPDAKTKADQATHDEQEKERHEWHLVKGTYAIAVFTLLLFLGTAALAVYTLKLWRTTRKIATDAESGSAKALAASTAATDLARKTAEHQLRAYIGIVGGAIVMNANKDLSVVLFVRNQGQTPAHKVQQFIAGEVRDFGNDAPGPFGDVRGDNWVMTPGTIWPVRLPDRTRATADGGAEVDLPFNQTEGLAVEMDMRQVVVWGKLTYRDVFDHSPERETRFCYRSGREEPLTPDEQRRGLVKKWEPEVCPEGNSST